MYKRYAGMCLEKFLWMKWMKSVCYTAVGLQLNYGFVFIIKLPNHGRKNNDENIFIKSQRGLL